jgi:hypothetical protein
MFMFILIFPKLLPYLYIYIPIYIYIKVRVSLCGICKIYLHRCHDNTPSSATSANRCPVTCMPEAALVDPVTAAEVLAGLLVEAPGFAADVEPDDIVVAEPVATEVAVAVAEVVALTASAFPVGKLVPCGIGAAVVG